jgi:hypothetical protein
MRADQKRAVDLALRVLREMTDTYSPTDEWSEEDWAIFQNANPLTIECQRYFAPALGDVPAMTELIMSKVLDKDGPLTMERGCLSILEDAAYRRRFFAGAVTRLFRSNSPPLPEWR